MKQTNLSKIILDTISPGRPRIHLLFLDQGICVKASFHMTCGSVSFCILNWSSLSLIVAKTPGHSSQVMINNFGDSHVK